MAVAAFFPGPLLWGANHLAYLPRWMTAAWIAAALLATIALAFRSRPPGAATRLWAEILPRFLFESRAGRVLVPLAGGLLFWILRSRSFFLGDGHLLGELTTEGVPFHGFDDMDYAVKAWLFRALSASGLAPAFAIFQGFSIGAGVLGVALSQALLRRLSWEGWRKTLAFVLLHSIAPVCLYFGYVEAYSFLAVFLSAFLLAGLLVLEGRISPWVCSLFFALAVLSHMTAVFSGPALAYLFFRIPGRSVARRLWALAAIPAVPAAIWILVHLVMGWDQGWLRRGFIENEHARRIFLSWTGSHGVLSGYHWKDLCNLALLTAPVPLVLVLVHGRRIIRRDLSPGAWFLVIQVISMAFWSILTDRKLGMARDWDLLAAHSAGLVLLAALLWHPRPEAAAHTVPAAADLAESEVASPTRAQSHAGPAILGGSGVAPPALLPYLACVALLLCAPWIALIHSDTVSALRLAGVAADFPDFAKPYTYEELGTHFRLKEDYERAEEMYKLCVESGPDNPRFRVNLATVYAIRGKRDLADREYRAAQAQFEASLRADPGNETVKRRLAQILEFRGEHARAADLYAELVQADPKDAALWSGLGQAAAQADRPAVAAQALRRALALGADPSLRQDLGLVLIALGRFDEAAGLFRQLLREGDANPATRLALAAALLSGVQAQVDAGASPSTAALHEAEGVLRQLLAAHPGDPDATEMIRHLESLQHAQPALPMVRGVPGR